MNNDWKKYLQTADSPHAGETADAIKADRDTIICDLSQFDTVVIAGDDAATFMQGQFTNDVDSVDENHSQLSAICNNKGRMIANFRLFKHQQNYFFSIKNDLTEKAIRHMQNYVLRAQVAIQDVSEQLIHIGISGDNAADLLSPFVENINTDIDSVTFNEDYIAICIAGTKPRYEIFCSLEQAKTIWQKVSDQATIVSPSVWDYLNIKVGLPLIDANTSEEFVPQMTNMELINGVSFTKGCFTGQEIIARTHYLGKQKRRTYRISIDSATRPKNGDHLATETSTENQYTGTLVSIYQTAENTYEALAVIQIKSAEEGQLKLKDFESKISLLELPYSLEESASE
jgi:folate-binding protein YgfZ